MFIMYLNQTINEFSCAHHIGMIPLDPHELCAVLRDPRRGKEVRVGEHVALLAREQVEHCNAVPGLLSAAALHGAVVFVYAVQALRLHARRPYE